VSSRVEPRAVSRKEETMGNRSTITLHPHDRNPACADCHKVIADAKYEHNQKVLCHDCYIAQLDAEIAELSPKETEEISND
jgi:hypothetical protein